MTRSVIVLNSGSSSVKFAAYAAEPSLSDKPFLRGLASGIGTSRTALRILDANGDAVVDLGGPDAGFVDHRGAVSSVMTAILGRGAVPVAFGHRVVHGGGVFQGPVLIDEKSLSLMESFTPLAPLHQPHNLSPVKALMRDFPEVPQTACFDTAFHSTIHEAEASFAIPRELFERGMRKYGFHGLSYEHVASRLPILLPGKRRVVAAHLGNGSSMCAILDGKSCASTMGFTALEGLPMGTRCGSVDPGLILHLMQSEGMGVQEVSDLLYKKSGLLGVSGISSDMRDILASDTPGARLAFDIYCRRIVREACSLAGAMGGVDAIVFTGGIGENSREVRDSVCRQLSWLGAGIDTRSSNRGESGERLVSDPLARLPVAVIPADEEGVIARVSSRNTGAA